MCLYPTLCGHCQASFDAEGGNARLLCTNVIQMISMLILWGQMCPIVMGRFCLKNVHMCCCVHKLHMTSLSSTIPPSSPTIACHSSKIYRLFGEVLHYTTNLTAKNKWDKYKSLIKSITLHLPLSYPLFCCWCCSPFKEVKVPNSNRLHVYSNNEYFMSCHNIWITLKIPN